MNITKSYRLPHRDEIINRLLRIGHTFLAHRHLLKRDSPPHCSVCQTQLIVEHVLLHCLTLNAFCANHFTITNLLDLFNKVTPRCIIDFIKEIGFYLWIWSLSFYVHRFYVCTNFIYCAYSFSKVSHFTYNVLSFLHFALYYNGLFLDRFYLDQFLALTAFLCWCAVKRRNKSKNGVQQWRPTITWSSLANQGSGL